MARPDPTSKVLPRWVTALVGGLPGLGAVAAFLLLYITDLRLRVFNLSPKDSFLVVGVAGVLVGTILALLIVCIALMRALRRAVRQR
jgi:hypothetical protein